MISLSSIDRQEVIRYLGYGQKMPDELTLETIDACSKTLLQNIQSRYLLRYFDIAECENGLSLLHTDFMLTGNDIVRHLEGCTKVALFCATLSMQADKLIRQAQIEDLTKGIIMDCCASTAIEQVCDQVDCIIAQEVETEGLFLTTRYSPGYGDLPISLQKEFLQLLDAPRKIGLCASQSHILIPRKSVTAIVGLSPHKLQQKQHACESCHLKENCLFRKRGDFCDISNTIR